MDLAPTFPASQPMMQGDAAPRKRHSRGLDAFIESLREPTQLMFHTTGLIPIVTVGVHGLAAVMRHLCQDGVVGALVV